MATEDGERGSFPIKSLKPAFVQLDIHKLRANDPAEWTRLRERAYSIVYTHGWKSPESDDIVGEVCKIIVYALQQESPPRS